MHQLTNSDASYKRSEALMRLTEADVRRKGEQTGSVRYRSGAWYIRFHQWCYVDGSYVWKEVERKIDSKGQVLTKKKAELYGYEQFVRGANELNKAPMGQMSLQFFYDTHYSPTIVSKYKKGWRQNVQSLMDVHIAPAFGQMDLVEIKRSMVQIWINEKAGRYSPQMVKHMANTLSQIFQHAIRLEFTQMANPAENLILPKLTHQERPSWTMDQIRNLSEKLRGAKRPDTSRMVLFNALTGVRPGEMAGLRWSSINWETEVVEIRETFSRGERETPKTAAGFRAVPLTKEAVNVLRIQYAMTKWKGMEHPVFAGPNGKPVNTWNLLTRYIKPAAAKLGMVDFDWHSERHTTATLVDQHVTPSQKTKLLGHTKPETSARYTHPDIEGIREALERATRKK